MLEGKMHATSSFVTLTYSDEFGPVSNSLNARHAQLWLKRLRKFMGTEDLRYFLVGEYGDETARPHFHVALFGYPSCLNGRTNHRRAFCCEVCQRIKETWGRGGIDSRELAPELMQYIVGYVCKKMTKKDDARLAGRQPEFARMSTHPGIGAPAMSVVASELTRAQGARLISSTGDVPGVLKHERKAFSLGRYLTGRLRIECGAPDASVPEVVRGRLEGEMRALWEATQPRGKAEVLEFFSPQQKVRQVEGRAKIHRKVSTL